MAEKPVQYDDEIELIDLIRVLWKYKWLIMGGTFITGLLSLVYCFVVPEVYPVKMAVRPGVLYTEEGGKKVFVDSIQNITGRIKAGIYDDTLIEKMNVREGLDKPDDLPLKVTIPPNSDVFEVACETSEIQEGTALLKNLYELLSGEEVENIKQVVEKYDSLISINKIKLKKKKEIEKSYTENIKNIEKRIQDIYHDIEDVNKNSVYLSYERKKLLERDADIKATLSVLLYSNTIQQNIQFVNNVKNELNKHLLRKEGELQKIIEEQKDQKLISEEIHQLETKRNNIKKMTLIKPPEAGEYPVKPRKNLIVLLSMVSVLFLMTFVSFFIEYLRNNTLTYDLPPGE